jgi:hypothetical protein
MHSERFRKISEGEIRLDIDLEKFQKEQWTPMELRKNFRGLKQVGLLLRKNFKGINESGRSIGKISEA